jgi:hypothetical protein
MLGTYASCFLSASSAQKAKRNIPYATSYEELKLNIADSTFHDLPELFNVQGAWYKEMY